MKMTSGIRVTLGAVVAAVSVAAWAEASETVAAPASATDGTMVAASGATSAKTQRKANRALRRKVYAALAGHKEINAGDISVTARSGAITLNGTVTDASQIDTVVQIAKGVAGVTSVTNRLSVQRPIGQ
ncbi:BON domain-containing protein [Paraburkholderia susongensis]|uniref:BON domain-containing protein n=1 Tax=Paraburkholderia susongensis TaxID=1515439 RepID=A0A1X7M030_9BURK|nr:BON domain-containing protein [Paraburkholderia susongensis]SMG59526.1 BON domain-containing protein [Paraburkholderia susongensis]